MKQRIAWLLMIAACLGLGLHLSCRAPGEVIMTEAGVDTQKSDVREVYARVCQSLEEVKGFHWLLTAEQKSNRQEMKAIQQNPDLIYLEVTNTNTAKTTEVYVKGNKSAFRTIKQGKWELLIHPQDVSLKEILPGRHYLKGVAFISPTQINNRNCPGISFTLTEEGFRQHGAVKPVNEKATDTYQLWFDPLTLRPYRLVISLQSLSQEEPGPDSLPKEPVYVPAKETIEISDYDKDIEVSLPDEIKLLFGIAPPTPEK